MSIKLLVADDSITIQKVIGIIFGGDEYSLTVVDNGKSAVDKAREIDPDILLVDALMPGMTGYEVAEIVRATPSLAAKPILLLTGSFEPFDEDKAKRCGADDFIAKPFESQQIISKVQELLELGAVRAKTMQAAKLQSPPEPLREQPSPVSAPLFDIPAPPFAVPPASPQPVTPADIWGAFTPEINSPFEAVTVPATATPAVPTFEPDVFAIVSEENEAHQIQPEPPPVQPPQQSGTQWIPVEENTFEFSEETVARPPRELFTEQPAPFQDASFGDIVFDDDTVSSAPSFPAAPAQTSTLPDPASVTQHVEQVDFELPLSTFESVASPADPFTSPAHVDTPVFAAPFEPAPVPEAVIPATATRAAAEPVQLTEDQLKAALTGLSKEVIERIVWEVVPDLAEAMIREAIRKIKEGV